MDTAAAVISVTEIKDGGNTPVSTDIVMVENAVVAPGATEVEVVAPRKASSPLSNEVEKLASASSSLRLSENVIDNDVENDTGGVATPDEELLLRSPDKAVTEDAPKFTKSWADEAG